MTKVVNKGELRKEKGGIFYFLLLHSVCIIFANDWREGVNE